MNATGDASMWRLLADNLPQHADKVALIDAKRQATYAQVMDEADLVAGWLAAKGIQPGDRVIVHLRKGIDEVTAMFGAWKIGAVVVNVNHQWTPAQLSYVAHDCRARAAILGANVLKGLASDPLPLSLEHLLVQGRVAALPDSATLWEAVSPSAAIEHVPDAGDLAAIIYTSGSTGKPKGVMLSHRNIRMGAISVSEYLELAQDDRLLSVLPYSFDAGLNQLTDAFLMGATVIHQPVSMPSEVVRMAADHQATTIAGVPPLWNQVVRYLADSGTALPDLRRVTNTGGKIPPNILQMMPQVFPGVDIYLMYGLTEAFRSTFLPPAKFAAKMGSIGRGIPNAQIFVVKHGEGIAGPGEQGELVHGGPLVSLGYWERPELTAEKIRVLPELRDHLGDAPVVCSGDLVRVDDDGDLWFVSRMDDMIKTQGFRLSPTEVEDILSQSGIVTDVVAFGVDDDDAGQVVHVAACLIGDADTPALLTHCRRAMAHYMVPRHIHAWQGAMPRTASGKLDRPNIIAATKAAHKKDAT
ncbi:AMP-binding protein [Paracoccus sp. YLB-12]|uniref:AMP-binding protein n=1 Tax=Paracoccus maritimus TaxID=2933292 RepID=A0ABT2K7W5_9RHOB|nr:AMP-binding protein [Paracoccus sp. YLB-12]MCT4332606.1 AMP-binding protein [Paracoccus sp. YLB-12]